MVESPELLSKVINWLSIPLTGIVGVLGFHYKRNLNRFDELEKDVSQLHTYNALNHKDIGYIKRSCDLMNSKLEKIEDKLNKRQSPNNKG
jgi:hypothetical protein